MVSSAVYSNRCVTTLEKHDRKAAWRICLLNGVTTEQPRSLPCHFVYVCMRCCFFSRVFSTLDLNQIWVCMSERKGYSDNFWCPATLPKLRSCLLLQTPLTLFSYPDVIITSRCMIFLTRVCNSATCIQHKISLMEQHRAAVVLYWDTLALVFFPLCRSFLIFHLHVLVSLGSFLSCLELRGAVYRTE